MAKVLGKAILIPPYAGIKALEVIVKVYFDAAPALLTVLVIVAEEAIIVKAG